MKDDLEFTRRVAAFFTVVIGLWLIVVYKEPVVGLALVVAGLVISQVGRHG